MRGDIQRALAHLQQEDLKSFKAVWLQSKLNSTGIQQRFKDWKTNYGNENVFGIIGYTLRSDPSEAVALWNVLKHEKDAYVRNLKEMCHLTDHDDEFSLHHEFNQNSARRSHERVCLLKKYLFVVSSKQ